ncbi:uncharacterized protein N7482_000242 [Penicillium canariense]|uniref:Methyltransferase domain-containing protein n=1 Tax=Penicillium canariense TaxID=189055 RepID=A0A9W9LSH0_9EURO|nr:uncharacterized protein N7482_000242 [Penicillium canariense]KAJ5174365.1 hypothetical protein N7482_000242 [Penicillium canariense]
MTEFTEANRNYFDQMAATYQSKFADSMKILSNQTLKHRLWLGDRWTDTEAGRGQEIKMLEYACGPGVISTTLAPFLTKVVGIDVSEKMVNEFNRNSSAIGLSNKMIGYKADLLAEPAPAEFSGPEFTDFDLVVVSMALHHFEHPDMALQRLATRLKKGGAFLIIDLVPHSGHDHENDHGHGHSHGHGKPGHDFGEAAHTVKTHGFSQQDMENLFQDAGLDTQFKYEVIPEELVFKTEEKTHRKTVFIARAQRT